MAGILTPAPLTRAALMTNSSSVRVFKSGGKLHLKLLIVMKNDGENHEWLLLLDISHFLIFLG